MHDHSRHGIFVHYSRRVLDREFWRKRRRRLVARAITGATGLIAATPRLRGLALRALLDRHLAPGTLCLVPFGDHALYVDPRDDKIALKLMRGRCWQRRELETAIDVLQSAGALRAGGMFIDVGANIGAVAIYALRSGVFTKVTAVEPDPHNFAILTSNIALNDFEQRVRAIKAAASDTTGHLMLARHRKNHGAHSVEGSARSNAVQTITVDAITLDDVLRQQDVAPEEVALVKIDVEGHELSVLEGMRSLLQVRVPILVELTAERGNNERLERFKSLLCPFYEHVLDLSGESPVSRPSQSISAFRLRNSQSDLLIY